MRIVPSIRNATTMGVSRSDFLTQAWNTIASTALLWTAPLLLLSLTEHAVTLAMSLESA